MGRKKNQKVEYSTLNQQATPTGSSQHPGAPKRLRADEPDADALNATLLANNVFAGLPIQQLPQQQVPKRVKLPPVFTTTREVAILQHELAAKQIHPLFKLCSQGTKILCSTELDYQSVCSYLEAKNLEFYTHDAPGSKPFKAILRGLPEKMPSAIIDELKAAKLRPINVFPIRRAENGNHRDRLYLVHFERRSITMADLQACKALFHIIVEWERYHPKKRDVTQCTNCQSYGHGTKNCHMKPRCGKCAGAHKTSLCDMMDESIKPKCVNCGAEHEGSNRACPKRAEFIEIRKKASSKNQRGRNRQPPPPPANTEENFPRLRYRVPNLPPLDLNKRNQTTPSVTMTNHRSFAAAAAIPSVKNVSSSGWGNRDRSAPDVDPLDDGTRFPNKILTELAVNLFERLFSCRSKRDQISAVVDAVQEFMDKYGP